MMYWYRAGILQNTQISCKIFFSTSSHKLDAKLGLHFTKLWNNILQVLNLTNYSTVLDIGIYYLDKERCLIFSNFHFCLLSWHICWLICSQPWCPKVLRTLWNGHCHQILHLPYSETLFCLSLVLLPFYGQIPYSVVVEYFVVAQ